MRTLAIGDIHGATVALDALLAVVQPTADDLLVFLGDYVSRGPDTKGAIDRLIALKQQYRVICLRGNHEIMMTQSRDSHSELKNWSNVGGRAALDSYASPGRAGQLADVPADHWHFLDTQLLPYFETDTHIFVHANLDANLNLANQSDNYLYWEFLSRPVHHKSGKVMICGHSSQRSGLPLAWRKTVCIDTAVYADGWLTCLDVDSRSYWQADMLGRSRKGDIQEKDS